MVLEGLDYKELNDGISVKIKVQPRASRNAVAGITGDSLKICLTSPPVDGEANSACISYVSDIFHVAKSKVIILSGHMSRNKILKITGIDKNDFVNTLASLLR